MTDVEALRSRIAETTAANVALAVRLEKASAWLDRPALTAEESAIAYHQAKVKAALAAMISREQLARLAAAYLRESR